MLLWLHVLLSLPGGPTRPSAQPDCWVAAGGLTKRISDLGGVMLKHRLTAPPEEAYSLHRKLSGAFLACIKLGAKVPCRQILLDAYDSYNFDD